MAAAEPAAKFHDLEDELAAKSSRIADLEARVALLEAENARLRTALAKGEATGPAGEGDPEFARLAAGSGGGKQEAVDNLGGTVASDAIGVSGREDEGDAGKGISPPESEGGADVEDEEGGGGSNKETGLGLEDDDVSVTPQGWGKKRAAARVVTSDSEDEDANAGDLGSGKDGDREQAVTPRPSRKPAFRGAIDSEDEDEDDDQVKAVTPRPRRKRAFLGASDSDSENEDGSEGGEDDENDRIPISQVLKKIRKGRMSHDGEFGEAKECSTATTRRSAQLVTNRSKKGPAARQPKEYEGSEDDMEQDDDIDEFIVDDDYPISASDSAEESCAEQEDSGASTPNEELSPGPGPGEFDDEISYEDVMDTIGRRKKATDWKFEAEMLSAFHKQPELCLKAVCALYRKQTDDEQEEKSALVHNKQGFNQIDAPRASSIAEFLLDGNPYGPVVKTVRDLEQHHPYTVDFCHTVAARYSKQLFTIYENKEDPYFHP